MLTAMRWALWVLLNEEETLILETGDEGSLAAYFHSETREGPWALRDAQPGSVPGDAWTGQLEGSNHAVRWQVHLNHTDLRPFARWVDPAWELFHLDRLTGWVEVDGVPVTLQGHSAILRVEKESIPAYGFLSAVRFERERRGTFAARLFPHSFWKRRAGDLHWATPEFVLETQKFRDHVRPIRWRTTLREEHGVYDLELWAADRFVLEIPEGPRFRYLSGLGTGWLRREVNGEETHRYFARFTTWVEWRTPRRLFLWTAEDAGDRFG